MRLYLQHPDPTTPESPRFVQLSLQPDLFGGWTLMRERGHVGGKSTLRRDHFPDQTSATRALEAARDTHLKRGFVLIAAGAAALA